MAKNKTYIIQYRMPLGLENPKINIPTANTPQEFSLTEGEVRLLRKLVPDIICVPANLGKTIGQDKESVKEQEIPEKPEETKASEPSDPSDEENRKEDSEETEDAPEADDNQEAQKSDETVNALAEDFPARELLIQSGLDTHEKILEFQKENNLTEIKGIGASTAEKISNELGE